MDQASLIESYADPFLYRSSRLWPWCSISGLCFSEWYGSLTNGGNVPFHSLCADSKSLLFFFNPLRGGSIFFLLVFLFLALMSTVFYSSMDGFYRSSGGYQLLNQPDFILPYRRMIDGSRIKGSSWYGCRSARCPVCLYEPNKQAYGYTVNPS